MQTTEAPVPLTCGGMWMKDIKHDDVPSWYKPKFRAVFNGLHTVDAEYIPPHAIEFDGDLELIDA